MTTLHYYGAQGRAQQIRWTLAEAGIEWKDEKAAFPPTPEVTASWVAKGGNSTTNVPMLEMDGKFYTQSSAVLRVAARKGGLMPADEQLQYEVDNIIAAVDDLRTHAYKVIFGPAEALAPFKEKIAPTHLANFERLLGDREFFVGDGITVADLTAFDVFNNFSLNLLPSFKGKYPKIDAFVDRIKARPNIAAYMASEKFTSLMPFGSKE